MGEYTDDTIAGGKTSNFAACGVGVSLQHFRVYHLLVRDAWDGTCRPMSMHHTWNLPNNEGALRLLLQTQCILLTRKSNPGFHLYSLLSLSTGLHLLFDLFFKL
jgi:hypothetical protein